MTFSEIKTRVLQSLNDPGSVYFSETDLNFSLTDAYDDTFIFARPQVKSVTLSFVTKQVYYDFRGLGVSDYLGTVAIFNNNNNCWLDDSCTLLDFERERDDWEIWTGQPEFWAPVSFDKIAIAPHHETAVGDFDLYYWSVAPDIEDSESPLFSSIHHKILEFYMAGDLLEQKEEYTKAQAYWSLYFQYLAALKRQTGNIARSNLLRVV
jgi:hypothetical protein